jgi:serine O-acetyltransferase
METQKNEQDQEPNAPSRMEHHVCATVAQLAPLYRHDGADSADGVMDGYPHSQSVVEALTILIDVMIPGRMSHTDVDKDELDLFLVRRLSQAWRLLRPEIERAIPFRWKGAAAIMEGAPAPTDPRAESFAAMRTFYARLPAVRSLVIEDIKAAYEGDPAALTYAEVQLAYPGLLAVVSYRLAHELYKLSLPIVPRIMSEWTHAQTGVDINPGAEIGHGFFIDHATGVVIGETCKIGNRVKLYQGVTLGAKSFALDENGRPVKHVSRHPTVEDDVVIYSNATILGGKTVIGRGSTIGGNVFLMESVPPGSFVASKHPELHIKTGHRPVD